MTYLQPDRREYGVRELTEANLPADPFHLFNLWLHEAQQSKVLDYTAMVLATVDDKGYPDTRVVLLKEFDDHGFVFFTHYTSPKAVQLEKAGIAALNFFWHELARQVRIRGKIERVSRHESEDYFKTRPRGSQIGALASRQSTVLQSRAELEKRVAEITAKYESQEIPCPENWGGYRVIPDEIEFFQGRDNRLNDRIRYVKSGSGWQRDRLSP